MKFLIINGANLNLLGIREPHIYGETSYEEFIGRCSAHLEKNNTVGVFYHSNCEGEIVDKIQSAKNIFDGIIINPGAFTHTSIAIYDALKIVGVPFVEVHISDIYKREDFRNTSLIGPLALKQIAGKGIDGYIEAFDFLINYLSGEKNAN